MFHAAVILAPASVCPPIKAALCSPAVNMAEELWLQVQGLGHWSVSHTAISR